MPEATLRAFADHGEVAARPPDRRDWPARLCGERQDAGIDLAAITAQLEREGVRSFCDSYHELLGCIEAKVARIEAQSAGAKR